MRWASKSRWPVISVNDSTTPVGSVPPSSNTGRAFTDNHT